MQTMQQKNLAIKTFLSIDNGDNKDKAEDEGIKGEGKR